MAALIDYVDPFHGNGTLDLPTPEGVAASWFFIKAQTGNTHPGACSPFGMVSVGAYSGAYPTGYGLNRFNTHGTPAQAFDGYTATGFTHFHQSGTGGIGTYYNYVRITPLPKGLAELGTRWTLQDESARPGYYAATLAEAGVRAELTVSKKAALHRYTFPRSADNAVAVDFSTGGLVFPNTGTYPSEGAVEVVSDHEVQGHIVMEGIRIYVYVAADTGVDGCTLWTGQVERRDAMQVSVPAEEGTPFGALFSVSQNEVTLRVGFSLRSVEQAKANAGSDGFEAVARATGDLWEHDLQRIQVEGNDDLKQVFYSALYHSLAKPADFTGESPFWDDGPLYLDFATMWDQYKTQLPLMLTVYSDRGVDAVNSTLDLAEHLAWFANSPILSADFSGSLKQARSLAHFMIADAFHRKLGGIDWSRAKDLMAADIERKANSDFLDDGLARPITHTLDLAVASWCTACMSRALGDHATAERFAELATRWRNAYDLATGRLPDDEQYYEGGAWNYSFRLLHDMAGRIGLYENEEAFVADLDAFFGYGQPSVVQPTDPDDTAYMDWGKALNRFEGLNNEPDFETPYAYLYAGRHDRTAEIVRAGMRYMFTTGRGGLPGNDDSGGTSSWYVWNAIGVFPVTGQPVLLIGSPIFETATIAVADRTFTVEAPDTSDENIYVQGANLNGEPLDRAYLSIDELMAGGTLSLEMGPRPSDWARGDRPPSYPGM